MTSKSKSGRALLGADSFPEAEVWGTTHRFVLNLFQKIFFSSLKQTDADAGAASSTRASRTMDVGINILQKFRSTQENLMLFTLLTFHIKHKLNSNSEA